MSFLQRRPPSAPPEAWSPYALYQQVEQKPLETLLIKWKLHFSVSCSFSSLTGCFSLGCPPTDDERTGSSSAAGVFCPDVKSRTLGSDSLFDLSEHEDNWEFKGIKPSGAAGGWSSSAGQKGSQANAAAPLKTLPEQLKVYKGEDLSGYKPTSPKSRRMLYSHNSSSRPSFPGSFFPLESSPRHQRRAVNISEPFAVSVPLRVSAVISSNSTPCRGLARDKAASLKPCRESSGESSDSAKSNSLPRIGVKGQEESEKKSTQESPSRVPAEGGQSFSNSPLTLF